MRCVAPTTSSTSTARTSAWLRRGDLVYDLRLHRRHAGSAEDLAMSLPFAIGDAIAERPRECDCDHTRIVRCAHFGENHVWLWDWAITEIPAIGRLLHSRYWVTSVDEVALIATDDEDEALAAFYAAEEELLAR